jgi:hypothetical protein
MMTRRRKQTTKRKQTQTQTQTQTTRQKQKRKIKTNIKSHCRLKSSSFVFQQNDYNANDGMMTSVWGPAKWHFLHTMSFNYPVQPTDEQKKQYRDFILHLQYVLPCGKCRKNLVENFKKLPLTMQDMTNRETFSKYIYNLHELINEMLHKKSNLTYEDVRERYEHFRARCLSNQKIPTLQKKKEKGCTEPLYGKKSKCVINIVPQKQTSQENIQIHKDCYKTKQK